MNNFIKTQILRMRIFLMFTKEKRTNYIIRKKIFYSVGENFIFQPRKIPAEPKLVKFGNNVTVASGVTFITHDIFHEMANNMQKDYNYLYYARAIEVGNNVFIGGNVTILPNVKIGNNVFIAAGSVVTKDVEDNSLIGGNPAKKISSFDDYLEKRKKLDGEMVNTYDPESVWRRFNYEKYNREN